MFRKFFSLMIVFGLWTILTGQAGSDHQPISKSSLPTSFLIGEHEQEYDAILMQYTKGLVELSGGTEKAYEIWTTVMEDLDDYSKKIELDLSGLKLWINLFFNTSGGIDYIVYYPKPNSKNMDFEKLTKFFSSFCKDYKMKYVAGEKCMLNATVSFPFQWKK